MTKKETEKAITVQPKKDESVSWEKERRNLLDLVPSVTFPKLPSVTFPNLYNKHQLDRGIQVIRSYSGQVSSGVNGVKDSISESYNQRTDKMKEQLLSAMLVLFDTK